jgi:hypothetical protein
MEKQIEQETLQQITSAITKHLREKYPNDNLGFQDITLELTTIVLIVVSHIKNAFPELPKAMIDHYMENHFIEGYGILKEGFELDYQKLQ